MLHQKIKLKLLVVDVDGTLTDAGIYYDESGNEIKKFCTRDAAGFFVTKKLGVKVMILTGRECKATIRRMQELDVDYVFQNIKEKQKFLVDFLAKENINTSEWGFIGDDLNDYSTMKMAGIKACPADSCKEIIALSDYVSSVKGGNGAFRDICENFLFKEEWTDLICNIYKAGI